MGIQAYKCCLYLATPSIFTAHFLTTRWGLILDSFPCHNLLDLQVIPPGGNTTFDVVFLGREAGLVENTLYIHTSAGSFRYTVEGTGTPNPYRIQVTIYQIKNQTILKSTFCGLLTSRFSSPAVGRCEASAELELLSGHSHPQPSPVDHPGWKQQSRINPRTN